MSPFNRSERLMIIAFVAFDEHILLSQPRIWQHSPITSAERRQWLWGVPIIGRSSLQPQSCKVEYECERWLNLKFTPCDRDEYFIRRAICESRNCCTLKTTLDDSQHTLRDAGSNLRDILDFRSRLFLFTNRPKWAWVLMYMKCAIVATSEGKVLRPCVSRRLWNERFW